jgi:D-3-phosphoglycerate dehydrogenase
MAQGSTENQAMQLRKVLVTAPNVSRESQQILRDRGFEVICMDEPVTEQSLTSRLSTGGTVAVMMRGSPPFTRRVLESAAGLRVIAKVGTGFDSVDMDAATARGIAVMTSGAASASAVAEHTLALMLSLARDLPRLDRNMRNGKWEQRQFKGREFRGRTVGIVGYGRIGQRVARLVKAFEAHVVVHSRSHKPDGSDMELEPDLDRLLARVDILTLHGRLTDETRGLIGKRQLALMKPGALLINTARGALVDESALVDALAHGRLAGAGLDVFAVEPIDPKNPLLALPNVIFTSHVAAAAQETVIGVSVMAAQNIVAYLTGGHYEADSLANPAVIGSSGG